MNAIFGATPIFSKEVSNIKKGEPIPVNQFSDCVTPTYGSSNFIQELNLIFDGNFGQKKTATLWIVC